MPRAKEENSSGLSFEIDNPKDQYHAGDTIAGRVVLNTPNYYALGKVTITFYGRGKTKILQHHGQGTSVHRGRATFFSSELVLYQGQYTHKPGSFSWPFSFKIPYNVTEIVRSGIDQWKPKPPYLTTEDEVLEHPLPPSTYYWHSMIGRQTESFVEYVLVATVVEPEESRRMSFFGAKKSTFPISLQLAPTKTPIADFQLVEGEWPTTIRTLKLLQEYAESDLGFRERSRSLFKRDSLPRFSFTLAIQYPTVIQPFHPDPIPFLVSVTPDLDPEKTTIDTTGQQLPPIKIRRLSMELKCKIQCRAPRWLIGDKNDSKTYRIVLIKRGDIPLDCTLEMSASTGFSKGKADGGLNLGETCNVRIGSAEIGNNLEVPLTPSFATYHLARTYHLTWELEIECADKIEKFSSPRNAAPCVLVAPPDDKPVSTRLQFDQPLEGEQVEEEGEEGDDDEESSPSRFFRPRRDHQHGREGGKQKQSQKEGRGQKQPKAEEAAEERRGRRSEAGPLEEGSQMDEDLPRYEP